MAVEEEVKEWVYEALRKDSAARPTNPSKPTLQLTDIELHVKARLQEAGEMLPTVLSYHTEIPEQYKEQIRAIIEDLSRKEIILKGVSSQQPDLPFFRVTEAGKKALEIGEYIPHDAQKYLDRLKTQVKGVDGSVLLYLQEGLASFRAEAYLACVVMVGVASEKTVLLLRDAIAGAFVNPATSTSFSSKTASMKVKQVFDEIWKRLDPVQVQLVADLGRPDLKDDISATFQAIRKTRNDAGHPTGRPFSREEAQDILMLFPTLLSGNLRGDKLA